MEKKANIRVTHLVPKGPTSDSKKQDAASKQWPKNSRRRESNGYSGSKDPTRSKPPNGGHQRIDKKPPRGRGQVSSEPQGSVKGGNLASSGSGAGLAAEEEDPVAQYELNSVFLPGSKKQNLNHLLNFHYAPRKVNSFTMRDIKGKSGTGKRMHYNKEQFLQANCQFVVKSSGEYEVHRSCPDTLVNWDQIEQIIIHSNEDAQCPICLYPPVAAKMTRCGHVYCWACILHYLALSDKSWRKCPICYDPVHVADLKSAVANYHHEFKTEEVLTLKLMKRKKGSLNVIEASMERDLDPLPHLFASRQSIVQSKLILADLEEVLSIVEHEQRELLMQMETDGPNGLNCPEMMFIQQALDLLAERKATINHLVAIEEAKEDKEIVIKATSDDQAGRDHDDYFYFYQAIDGQNLYLHTVNNRMIQAEFGELRKGPPVLSGKIVQKDSFTMDETLRKRLKYLQHLPMTCQFDVVELIFDTPIVSPEVMNTFDEELKSRAKNRQVRAREERIREKRINEVYDRQMGKMLAQSVDIDFGSPKDFPMCGSFTEKPLEMSESPTEIREDVRQQGPSFAKMLSSPSEGVFWPSLMDKKAPVESPWSKIASTGGTEEDAKSVVPDFRRAFSTDMAMAMEKAEASRKEGESKKVAQGKAKKKQQMVLFSTDMNFKRN